MPAISHQQLADFVELTLKEIRKEAWTDISLNLQRYIAMSRLFRQNAIGYDGGEQLRWQVKVRNTGAARNTAPYDEDNIEVQDVMQHCLVPWSMQKVHFAYDDREPGFQSGMTRIVEIIKVRRHAAMCDLAELLEQNFWGMPSSSTDPTELLKPFGLPYWITGYGAGTSFGFNGKNNTIFTNGAGGLNSDTYPAWANGNGKYTVISKTDLIRMWREAATKCDFMPPVPYPDVAGPPQHAYYTPYSVLGRLEEMLEAQNENLGNDVASKDGQTVFRRSPVIWAPYLDQNTISLGGVSMTDPIYGIDWGCFKLVFKTGELMKETPPLRVPTSHRVWAVWIDNTQQFQCTDRRRCFVLYKA